MPEAPSPFRPHERTILQEALAGLSASPKTLPPKLFYDEEGCRLFGQITQLPEYYLTRTEQALLLARADDLVADLPDGVVLVEYGASSADKAAILLDALIRAGRRVGAYVPIDIAADALEDVALRLRSSHPGIPVYPVHGDFLGALRLPESVATSPLTGFFPGSTIGNLDTGEATSFLRAARLTLGSGARFLIGADLHKDASVLIPAYDDAAGVTAAFNLNILTRLNRDVGADFNVAAFSHRVVWNADEHRIEMHLASRRQQIVHIGGQQIHFDDGETIHTENSYKRTLSGFQALARDAGWRPVEVWTDPDRLFALHMLAAVQ